MFEARSTLGEISGAMRDVLGATKKASSYKNRCIRLTWTISDRSRIWAKAALTLNVKILSRSLVLKTRATMMPIRTRRGVEWPSISEMTSGGQ